ncbi:hypothetical protein quinque_011602 [Culex quinquefasciatus]
MQLLTVLCFVLLLFNSAWTSTTPEDPEESTLTRTKRFWNLAPEPNYDTELQAINPVQRPPIGWLIPPDYSPPAPKPSRRRPTTTRPTHGLAYEIVKGVVLAGASNVVRVLSQTTPRPLRWTTASQLKRRSGLPNPADENSVLVPVTTYGQDNKPIVVYMFVPKDRILGYQKEDVESSVVED